MPLATVMNVSASKTAALPATLFVTNKVLLIVAVAVLGKLGFLQVRMYVCGYASVMAPVALCLAASALSWA